MTRGVITATLALDLADVCGWAYDAGDGAPIRYGVWHLKRPSGPDDRLAILYHAIMHGPAFDRIIYEEAAFGARNRHTRQVHAEKIGVLRLAAHQRGAETLGVNPGTLKLIATGHGKANKARMVQACRDKLGFDVSDDNIADAIWLLHVSRHAELLAPRAKRPRPRAKRRTKTPNLF